MSTSLKSIIAVLALSGATVVSAGGLQPFRGTGPVVWNGPGISSTFENSQGDQFPLRFVDPADMVFSNHDPDCGGAGTTCPLGPGSITESCSCDIVPLNSVACAGGGLTTINAFLREFDNGQMHGGPYSVGSVDFGVEALNGNPLPVDVNLYTLLPGQPVSYAFMNLVATGSTVLTGGDAGTIVNVPVAATINAPDRLVVEILTADGQVTGSGFWPGSNPFGQSGPTYLAAAACGVPDPLETGALGFPNMHLVMMVNPPAGAVENCQNGVDDDGDGDVDCDDSDCAGDPACAGGGGDCDLTEVLDALALIEAKLDDQSRFDGIDGALALIEAKLDDTTRLDALDGAVGAIEAKLDALDLSSFDDKLCEIINLLVTPQGQRQHAECGGGSWNQRTRPIGE